MLTARVDRQLRCCALLQQQPLAFQLHTSASFLQKPTHLNSPTEVFSPRTAFSDALSQSDAESTRYYTGTGVTRTNSDARILVEGGLPLPDAVQRAFPHARASGQLS